MNTPKCNVHDEPPEPAKIEENYYNSFVLLETKPVLSAERDTTFVAGGSKPAKPAPSAPAPTDPAKPDDTKDDTADTPADTPAPAPPPPK